MFSLDCSGKFQLSQFIWFYHITEFSCIPFLLHNIPRFFVSTLHFRNHFQEFRRGKGEVTELVLIDGWDDAVINGCKSRILLGEVWIKIIHIFCSFLGILDFKI